MGWQHASLHPVSPPGPFPPGWVVIGVGAVVALAALGLFAYLWVTEESG